MVSGEIITKLNIQRRVANGSEAKHGTEERAAVAAYLKQICGSIPFEIANPPPLTDIIGNRLLELVTETSVTTMKCQEVRTSEEMHSPAVLVGHHV
jgi:hypothetical protein